MNVPLTMKIFYAIGAIIFGLGLALLLSGCITPGIEFRSSYGNVRYDGKTVSYELPSDPSLKK